ncbi:hypothetical protein IPJ72_04125 [Candidatus Peregrinibacteria bacterium]|nr:MAG: hypothetical protein IPJ72_04125 [Candidatus Peregrinibacteria bacterium]
MKFTIKASAVAVSDTKFAKRGEYETEDAKEIERLKNIAKKFPKDVEELSGSKKKDEPKEETNSEETTVVDEPQEEHPRRRR